MFNQHFTSLQQKNYHKYSSPLKQWTLAFSNSTKKIAHRSNYNQVKTTHANNDCDL